MYEYVSTQPARRVRRTRVTVSACVCTCACAYPSFSFAGRSQTRRWCAYVRAPRRDAPPVTEGVASDVGVLGAVTDGRVRGGVLERLAETHRPDAC